MRCRGHTHQHEHETGGGIGEAFLEFNLIDAAVFAGVRASSCRLLMARMGVSLRPSRTSSWVPVWSGRSVCPKVEMVYWLGWPATTWLWVPSRRRIVMAWCGRLTTVARSAVVILGALGLVTSARKMPRQLAAPELARTSWT